MKASSSEIYGDANKREGIGRRSRKLKALPDEGQSRKFEVEGSWAPLGLFLSFRLPMCVFFLLLFHLVLVILLFFL